MRKRLLNFSKNLIIALALVVAVMTIFFTTSSYAASQTLGQLMRHTVSDWYRFIVKICIAVYAILYLIIILKLLADRTPEKLKLVKDSIFTFLVMFALLYFFHYVMLMIIGINQEGVQIAKNIGISLSGVDVTADESDLYETALSKAYEIAAVPGFIGLIMYLLLVFYTYKFVIVYAKRYINIIVLILIGPIMVVVSTIKKIITGVSDGGVRKWFKEFTFNVIIQTLHAIFYATFIGFTLKLSENNENLVGALLTLILFGFIFRIDAIIRKMFNFVGGSTNIRSSNRISSMVDTTANAFEGGAKSVAKFGKDIKENGIGEALGSRVKRLPEQVGNTFSRVGNNAKNGMVNVGNNIVTGIKNTGATLQAEYKDRANILNGNRVKKNLTSDEIVAQMHIMEEKEGLEALRQGVQAVGYGLSNGMEKAKKIGKYTSKQLEKYLAYLGKEGKKELKEIQNDYGKYVTNLENSVEMIKRVPKIMNSHYNEKNNSKNTNGLPLNIGNTMMLVANNINLEKIIDELRKEYGENVDASVFMFERMGAQVFLSSTGGSPRMGMAVLAEENYEAIAEHRINGVVTGNKNKNKVTIRRPKKLANQAKNVNQVYTFNRFSPKAAKKITNRMLQKSREQNRYLVAISQTYDNLKIGNIKPRGSLKSKTTEISHTMKATRKNVVKSVKQIKLSQTKAVQNYQKLASQTKLTEMANDVANRGLSAKNMIQLNFRQIDHMTPGQIGLRKMIKEGDAYQLSNGFVMMKKENKEVKDRQTIRQPEQSRGELAQQGNEVINGNHLELHGENTVVDEKAQKFDDLLQDLKAEPLLEQVVANDATEETKALDEVIANSALEAKTTNLKYLDYYENEEARNVAIEHMVSTGVLTPLEASNEDVVGNALDILNNRVQELADSNSDLLVEKAAEIEYVRLVEESIQSGEFEKNKEVNVDEKMNQFSNLLMDVVKEYVEPSTRFPKQIIEDTIKNTTEIVEIAAEDYAKAQFEKELEKAEKRWAKKHKTEVTNIVDKYNKQQKEDTEEIVKITLKFFGAVESQGQSITLSNKHSVKDFYDKVKKLENADLNNTQERFLQVYGDKLSQMQLLPFSFAKCPVLDMDGWSIYVVTKNEDVLEGEKTINKVDEPIEQDIEELIEIYYIDIKRIFTTFTEEQAIESFEELYKDNTQVMELTRRIRMFLFRHGEADNQSKAVKIVDNLEKDVRFRQMLEEQYRDRLEKQFAMENVKKAKEKMEIKSKEEAEKQLAKNLTKAEVEETKKREKDNFANQVFSELAQTEAEEMTANPDLQELLDKMRENKVYVEVGTKGKKDKKVFPY